MLAFADVIPTDTAAIAKIDEEITANNEVRFIAQNYRLANK
jgi:hypothetical protein